MIKSINSIQNINLFKNLILNKNYSPNNHYIRRKYDTKIFETKRICMKICEPSKK